MGVPVNISAATMPKLHTSRASTATMLCSPTIIACNSNPYIISMSSENTVDINRQLVRCSLVHVCTSSTLLTCNVCKTDKPLWAAKEMNKHLNYFRSSVGGCNRQARLLPDMCGAGEVHKSPALPAGQPHDVGRFDVSVHEASFVQVDQALGYVGKNLHVQKRCLYHLVLYLASSTDSPSKSKRCQAITTLGTN